MEEEIERLRARLAAYEITDQKAIFQSIFGLTAHEAEVLLLLFRKPLASREDCMTILYSNKQEEPGIKIIDVLMVRVRAKLVLHDVRIETVWGTGYCINSANKLTLHNILAEAAQ